LLVLGIKTKGISVPTLHQHFVAQPVKCIASLADCVYELNT